MRFLKRLSALLLAMLSLFSLSLVACKKEQSSSTTSTSTPPSIDKELPLSYKANYYDVNFKTTLAEDKKSIVIEATPLYHIYNLEIETKILFDSFVGYTEASAEIHTNRFQRAPAHKTIYFSVSLSETKLANGNLIEAYKCDVINGQYIAEKQTTVLDHGILFSQSGVENFVFDPTIPCDFCLPENICFYKPKKENTSIIGIFVPQQNCYNVKMEYGFDLKNESGIIIRTETQSIAIDFIPMKQGYSYYFSIPDFYINEGYQIYYFDLSVYADIIISPQKNAIPTDEYWAQFE